MVNKENDAINSKKLSFESEGIVLVGVLRSPKDRGDKKFPLVIIAPSWINVKEQFAAIYGERLAALGYNTFAITRTKKEDYCPNGNTKNLL
jgi:dienelactone hydrolase